MSKHNGNSENAGMETIELEIISTLFSLVTGKSNFKSCNFSAPMWSSRLQTVYDSKASWQRSETIRTSAVLWNDCVLVFVAFIVSWDVSVYGRQRVTLHS